MCGSTRTPRHVDGFPQEDPRAYGRARERAPKRSGGAQLTREPARPLRAAAGGGAVSSVASLMRLPGLAADLERVEAALRAAVRTPDPFLTDVASHLINAGGKRLRPALALTGGRLGVTPVTDDV